MTTGSPVVPPYKADMGYRYEPDKFGIAGLTALASEIVSPPRVAQCPIQLEAVVDEWHVNRAGTHLFDVSVTKVWATQEVRLPGHANRIDPDAWRPLLMSFQQFYGLAPERLHRSELARIPESAYRP